MYSADWIKEINESYISNIRNSSSNEQQLNEELRLAHVAVIVDSIETTFDVQLTEEQIQEIYEKVELNEVVGLLLKLAKGAATIAKNVTKAGVTKAGGKLISGGSKATAAERAAAKAAAKKANYDAMVKYQKDFAKAEATGGPLPLAPETIGVAPARTTLQKFKVGAGKKLRDWGKGKTTLSGKKITKGSVGAAGAAGAAASGYGAYKLGDRLWRTAETLLTGSPMTGTRREKISSPDGEDYGIDTDWEYKKYKKRTTGVKGKPVVSENTQYITEYVSTTTSSTVQLIESMYDVKLTEDDVRHLAYTIGKKFV